MAEWERKRSYRELRVLIESARVLDSDFADSVLSFSGGQVELLRNLMQYLHRRDTFVSAYHDGYYLVPDDADWDDLQAVIADLEDELMGNPNVIFGYKDRWAEDLGGFAFEDNGYTESSVAVPAGYVYVVQFVYASNRLRAATFINLLVSDGTTPHFLVHRIDPSLYEVVSYSGAVILKEGDFVTIEVGDVHAGDEIASVVWGYKMAV